MRKIEEGDPQELDNTVPCDEHFLVRNCYEDMAAAKRYLIRAPKRRAFPDQGVPAEAVPLAPEPGYVSRGKYDARKNKVGIGHETELRRPRAFLDLL